MIVTEPPPGIVNVPHVGVGEAATGLTVAGRVAPPAVATVVVEAYVNPAGNVSAIETFVAAARPAPLATVMAYVAVPPAPELMTSGVDVLLPTVNTGTHSVPLLVVGSAPSVVEVVPMLFDPPVAP